MSKFKVGDRVKVYGFWSRDGFAGQNGTVLEVYGGGGLRIELTKNVSMSAHEKQCRRLVKKKKRKEITILTIKVAWMRAFNDGQWVSCFEFIEELEKILERKLP